MSPRHRWEKQTLHQYRCVRCGLERRHQIVDDPNPYALVRWETRFVRDGRDLNRGRTPPCPGQPPAPPLVWTRVTAYHAVSDTGHAVSASKDAAGWKFSAWAPDCAPGVRYDQWPPQEQRQVQFKRGEQVPQRRPLLGVFADAEDARACCAVDAATRLGATLMTAMTLSADRDEETAP